MERYRSRISGPLLDRFDLQVEVPALSFAELSEAAPRPAESSAVVRARVAAARVLQVERAGACNAALTPPRLRRLVAVARDARALLADAVDRRGLSARAHDRILRLALTLRDLETAAGADPPPKDRPIMLSVRNVGEALAHRALDTATVGPRLASPGGPSRGLRDAGRAS